MSRDQKFLLTWAFLSPWASIPFLSTGDRYASVNLHYAEDLGIFRKLKHTAPVYRNLARAISVPRFLRSPKRIKIALSDLGLAYCIATEETCRCWIRVIVYTNIHKIWLPSTRPVPQTGTCRAIGPRAVVSEFHVLCGLCLATGTHRRPIYHTPTESNNEAR